MSFPVLTATGYFDDDQPGSLRYYRRHISYASPSTAKNHFLIIGPWDHPGTNHPNKEIEGLAIPEAAVLDMDKLRADEDAGRVAVRSNSSLSAFDWR